MSTIKHIRSLLKSLLLFIGLFYLPATAVSQPENSDTVAAGKAETNIEMVFTEENNRSKILTATVKTKVDDTYQGVKGVTVSFYQKEVNPACLLGKASSNEKGIAVFAMPEEKLNKMSLDYTVIAAIENNEAFEDNQEEITVGESEFNMMLAEEDSVRQVVISLQAPDAEGKPTPVAEAEVHLYVQRLFGLLPLSEDPETTDENGEVTVEFPAGIPGDAAGNLIIVAKVEDHERFGNLEFRRKINWGTPLVIDTSEHVRELWSSRANAPLYLIIFVNTMLIGIWGVIAYIIYEVFQIKKIGRQSMH